MPKTFKIELNRTTPLFQDRGAVFLTTDLPRGAPVYAPQHSAILLCPSVAAVHGDGLAIAA
eukprot:scaffold597775_cov24-Prasinocladus_malaysianus.AAC.1